jgi:hypothetical protein
MLQKKLLEAALKLFGQNIYFDTRVRMANKFNKKVKNFRGEKMMQNYELCENVFITNSRI